jgi:hypothetical protein
MNLAGAVVAPFGAPQPQEDRGVRGRPAAQGVVRPFRQSRLA